ncbi:hypothetical protein Nhal_1630 [Nitrosococcus halophilus Nc 4]|uniref:Uncharacterized protein n=1 Tax=Nitrosococcus halophilus (strain Nc4) TaxID=472759 RepID=D5C2A5_NITHN|nr:hypothetical protein Nhal_1630 [Nitrosococcus halophilus Nc 4]
MNHRIAALEFISQSISPNYSPKTIESLLSFIDSKWAHWEYVAFLANTHLVTPALWAGLNHKNLCNQLPKDFRTYLAELHRQNTVRNSHLMRQLLEVLQKLNQNNIKWCSKSNALSL